MQQSWNSTTKLVIFLFLKGYLFRPTIKPLRFKVTFWSMWKQCVLAPLYKENLLRNLRISISTHLHPPEHLTPAIRKPSEKSLIRILSTLPNTMPPAESSRRPAKNPTSGRDPHGSGKCGRTRSRPPCVYSRNVNMELVLCFRRHPIGDRAAKALVWLLLDLSC